MQGALDVGSEREVGVDTLWGGGVGRQASPCADAPGKVLSWCPYCVALATSEFDMGIFL
jgi:hypothetical protein